MSVEKSVGYMNSVCKDSPSYPKFGQAPYRPLTTSIFFSGLGGFQDQALLILTDCTKARSGQGPSHHISDSEYCENFHRLALCG